ncbi:MAG: hypothetical protein ACYC1C_11140, partial [Chloroflexota bacterium]
MVTAGRFHRLSVLLAVAMVLAIVVSAVPPLTAQAAALDYDIPNGHFYTQTNGQSAGASQAGFSVSDKDGVPFWSDFRRLGGIT